MKLRNASWTLTLPVLALLISIASVSASGVGIQPNRIDTIVPYGETKSIEIAVTNPGDDPMQVDVSLMGLEMAEDGSLLWLGNDGTDAAGNVYPYSNISPHVTFEPASFTIEPHSEVALLVQVRAPDTYQEEGMAGCVGALWFDVTSASADSDEASPFNTVFRLVAFVLVKFDGGQQRIAKLASLPIYQDDQMDLHLPFLLSNLGNVHISLTGQVVIREAGSGEIVDSVGFSEGTALPQRPREYQGLWMKSALRQGEFIVEFIATYDTSGPELTDSIWITIDKNLVVHRN